MEDLQSYVLATEIYGNSLLQWSVAILCALTLYVGLLWVRGALVGRLTRSGSHQTHLVKQLVGTIARTTRQFFLIALALAVIEYIAVLPPRAAATVSAIVTIATMLQVGLWCTGLLGLWITRYLVHKEAQDPESASAGQIIRLLCLVAIWSAILLLTLSNFGVDITGLVAGLGIGGVAIAFALQSILRDLFASLAIVLDKPFVVGDFIIFGENLGSVERIGLKTTRVRSLWGEQITVSNDDLLNSRVRNYKRMAERRISFNVTVTYETPVDKLERIPEFIRDIIESVERTRFDRCHVAAFEQHGPRIETVFYVLSPDYNIYMDIQQRINLNIARRFEEEGIAFAYPTQRLLFPGEAQIGRPPRRATG